MLYLRGPGGNDRPMAPSRSVVEIVLHLFLALAVIIPMFLHATLSVRADGGAWRIEYSGNSLGSGARFRLYNVESGQYVHYASRRYGINLVWTDDPPNPGNFVVERRPWIDASGPIRFGEFVALKEMNPDGGYIHYGEREYGINLVWSDEPVYEWELRDPYGDLADEPIPSGASIVLFNRTAPQPDRSPWCGALGRSVVYGERPYGINLVWNPPGKYDGSGAWWQWPERQATELYHDIGGFLEDNWKEILVAVVLVGGGGGDDDDEDKGEDEDKAALKKLANDYDFSTQTVAYIDGYAKSQGVTRVEAMKEIAESAETADCS